MNKAIIILTSTFIITSSLLSSVTAPNSLEGISVRMSPTDPYFRSVLLEAEFKESSLSYGFAGNLIAENLSYNYINNDTDGTVNLLGTIEIVYTFNTETSGTYIEYYIDNGMRQYIEEMGTFEFVPVSLTVNNDWRLFDDFTESSDEYWSICKEATSHTYDGAINFVFDDSAESYIDLDYMRSLPSNENWQIVAHAITSTVTDGSNANFLSEFEIEIDNYSQLLGFEFDVKFFDNNTQIILFYYDSIGTEITAYSNLGSKVEKINLRCYIATSESAENERVLHFEYATYLGGWNNVATFNLDTGAYLGQNLTSGTLNKQLASSTDRFAVSFEAETASGLSNPSNQVQLSVDNIGIDIHNNDLYFSQLEAPSGSAGDYLDAFSIVGCDSEISGDVIIPYSFDGLPVVKIIYATFQSASNITSITIPDSITYIGSSAFGSCTGLTSITIPDSVTTIDEYAFAGCTNLTSINIPAVFTPRLALLGLEGELLLTTFYQSIIEYLSNDETFISALDRSVVGQQGPKGDQGPAGETGPQGIKGDTGAQGSQGLAGPVGERGLTGSIGPQGIQGLQGSTGIQGLQGEVGPPGLEGPQGPAGYDSSAIQTLRATPHIQADQDGTFQVKYSIESSDNLSDWNEEMSVNSNLQTGDSGKQFLRLRVE